MKNMVSSKMYTSNSMRGYRVSLIHKRKKKDVSMLTKLRNMVMHIGKKFAADKVINNILILLRTSGVIRPISILIRSIRLLMPLIETRPVKRGSRVLQVPKLISKPRSRILAIRWLVESAKHRSSGKRDAGMHGLSYGMAQEVRAICLDSIMTSKNICYSEAIAKRNKMHKNANSHRVNTYIKGNKKY